MSTPVLKTLPCARAMLMKLCKPKYTGGSTMCLRNYWRRNVFSEISSAMQSMENRMRDMDKEMNRLFNEFSRTSPVRLPSLFSLETSRAREIPVVSTDGDSRTYRLELDMEGMEPENINVTLKDHELTIVARVEETKSDGSRFMRENSYHYTLPKEVNPETIRSSLSNGVLTIEAPLPALESKEIPVKIEGAENSSDAKKQ